MLSVICPGCKREVRAKGNMKLALRYHLDEYHNTLGQEEREGIVKEAMACIKGSKWHDPKNPPIPPHTPQGLRLLLENKRDYAYILEKIEGCCNAHPECKYEGECKRIYDMRCKKWHTISEDAPKKEQSPIPFVEVEIPSASHEEVMEAIEKQLAIARYPCLV